MLSAQQGVAVYDVTFSSTWSAATHPVSFPSNPHFSPLIGGSHDASTSFWQRGGLASPGMESMAETGATTLLTSEVNAAIAAGGADQVLRFSGLSTSPASRGVRMTLTAEFSHVTLVSMLAPSPDWFVGVSGLDLRPGGQWVTDLTVPLRVYDSGTDSGTSYTSPNANTVPADPIDYVTTASGPFAGLPGPVGTYRFVLRSSTSVYGCANPQDSLTVGATTPQLGQQVSVMLHDPTGTLGAMASTVLGISAQPAPGFPCGVIIPGHGLGGPGAPGELLLGGAFPVVPGPVWNGSPVTIALGVPNNSSLVGAVVFAQGALWAPSHAGLTDAVELRVGR